MSLGGSGGGGLGSQYYSLRWNNHPINLVSVFTGLYQVNHRILSSRILLLKKQQHEIYQEFVKNPTQIHEITLLGYK